MASVDRGNGMRMDPSRFHRSVSKWCTNALLALGCLVLLLVLLPLLAIAIKLTSKGPVFYRQDRVGRNGRVYYMWKLRTMRVDAEVSGNAQWAQLDDPRVTSVGKRLRKHRLDELPNVINVLNG